jgi:hypothetical protein
MFPICVHFEVPELGNTRVLVVHHLRKKMDCRVKPGNDGGGCMNFAGARAAGYAALRL